jgi:hypothetical protein
LALSIRGGGLRRLAAPFRLPGEIRMNAQTRTQPPPPELAPEYGDEQGFADYPQSSPQRRAASWRGLPAIRLLCVAALAALLGYALHGCLAPHHPRHQPHWVRACPVPGTAPTSTVANALRGSVPRTLRSFGGTHV